MPEVPAPVNVNAVSRFLTPLLRSGVMFRFINTLCVFMWMSCRCTWIAAADVIVDLKSGQRIRATSVEMDSKSPERIQLWQSNEQIRMRRVISWTRIQQISAPTSVLKQLTIPMNVRTVDPEAKPAEELTLDLSESTTRENALRLQEFAAKRPTHERLVSPDEVLWMPPVMDVVPAVLVPALCPPILLDPGRVVGVRPDFPCVNTVFWDQPDPREIKVSVRPINRNGLVDINALEISIQGRTALGQSCLVRGTLKTSLWVRRAQMVRAYAEVFFEEPRDLYQVAQWSNFIDATDVDATGIQKIVVNLPQRPSDQNLNWGEFGLLTADLDVPGQGRLATSSDAIPLRQGGPNRSRSVVDFGSSLLPGESTTEGLLNSGYWPRPSASIRPDRRIFTTQP